MTTPITAQPLYSQSFRGTLPLWQSLSRVAIYLEKQRYKQTKPYNLPLPYSTLYYNAIKPSYNGELDAYNVTGTNTRWCKSAEFDTSDLEFWARSRARSKFNSELGDPSGWLMTLLERQKAMDMVTSRLTQLVSFTRHLKRFEFGHAAEAILHKDDTSRWSAYRRAKSEGRFKRGSRHFANNYLEFHFGLSPILGDIDRSIKTLTGPIPFGRVKGYGRALNAWTIESPQGDDFYSTRAEASVKVRYYADVSVDNPNLWLANRLGLVNPLAAAVDKIAFSFVADWFFNLSEVLNQFGATAGLTVLNQHYSVKTDVSASWVKYSLSAGDYVVNETGKNVTESFRRIIGDLPVETLKFRRPWDISPRRGAAMASLLIQQLPSREAALDKKAIRRFKVLNPYSWKDPIYTR